MLRMLDPNYNSLRGSSSSVPPPITMSGVRISPSKLRSQSTPNSKFSTTRKREGYLVTTMVHPLHQAALSGNVEQVNALVNLGINVDVKDKSGRTALHMATAKRQLGVIRILGSLGTNVDSKDNSGETALHVAASVGFKDGVVKLIEMGANVEVQSVLGAPLHCAAKFGHIDVVKVLVFLGANIESANSFGMTAFHIATHFEKNDVANELIQMGAKERKAPFQLVKTLGGKSVLACITKVKNFHYMASLIT